MSKKMWFKNTSEYSHIFQTDCLSPKENLQWFTLGLFALMPLFHKLELLCLYWYLLCTQDMFDDLVLSRAIDEDKASYKIETDIRHTR